MGESGGHFVHAGTQNFPIKLTKQHYSVSIASPTIATCNKPAPVIACA